MNIFELFMALLALIGFVSGPVIGLDYGVLGAVLGAVGGGVLGYFIGPLVAVLTIAVSHVVMKLERAVRPSDDKARRETTSDTNGE